MTLIGSRIVVIWMATLLSVPLVGCYGPDMTMMVVEREQDGSLVFTIPVCGNDAPRSVTLKAGTVERGLLSYDYPADSRWSGGDLEFALTDEHVRNGQLGDFGLVRSGTWNAPAPQGIHELDWILVKTTAGEVSANPSVFAELDGPAWVVHGFHSGVDFEPPPAISIDEAHEALREACR